MNIKQTKAFARVQRIAASCGATIDCFTKYDFAVDAPSGYTWRATSSRGLYVPFSNGSQTWIVEACESVITDMLLGLDKVTDEAELAEHRWDLDDDTWGAPDDAPEFIEVKGGA